MVFCSEGREGKDGRAQALLASVEYLPVAALVWEQFFLLIGIFFWQLFLSKHFVH